MPGNGEFDLARLIPHPLDDASPHRPRHTSVILHFPPGTTAPGNYRSRINISYEIDLYQLFFILML